MTPFYSTKEQIEALEVEARSWLGTPFAAHAMAKGHGVDCPHLPAACYLKTGLLTEFKAPAYALDEGTGLLLKWLAGDKHFEKVDPASPQPGDTLCFHWHTPHFHAGLMITGGNFIHVLPKRRVIISNLRESFYHRRIVAVYRPVEVVA